ncbi:MAG: GspH/FimT family protein [Phycisphaerae bacterium]
MTRRRIFSAFTLLELVLVLALISLVMLASAHSLARWSQGQGTLHAAEQFVALTRWTRSRAITEGITHRIHLQASTGKWWVTQAEDDHASPLPTRLQPMPESVRFETDAPLENGVAIMEFDPSGRTVTARVVFSGQRGETITVGCPSAYDLYRILPAAEGR